MVHSSKLSDEIELLLVLSHERVVPNIIQANPALWVWGRVAGDAMDAAVLARGLGSGNSQRGGAVGAMLFVLATTTLDVAVAASLNQRQQTALQTGRRTRVRRAVSST